MGDKRSGWLSNRQGWCQTQEVEKWHALKEKKMKFLLMSANDGEKNEMERTSLNSEL